MNAGRRLVLIKATPLSISGRITSISRTAGGGEEDFHRIRFANGSSIFAARAGEGERERVTASPVVVLAEGAARAQWYVIVWVVCAGA